MRTARLLVAAALLPTLACAGRGHHDPGAVEPLAGPMAVVIENHHYANVRIFVVHDGQTSRLGLVPAVSSATFDLPPTLVGQSGEIRLIAYPVAAFEKLVSEAVVVKPGQQVSWTLESSLARSSLAVY
jgi:hypothetical protein